MIWKNKVHRKYAIGAGAVAGTVLGAWKGLEYIQRKKLDQADISDEIKEIKKLRLKNIVTNVTMLASSLALYYFGSPKDIKPAAVIGGIPIGTAIEVSHAMSERMLKYRATGGIFLAHQEGGDESLRLICETFGENRFLFLILLDFLFLWGTSRTFDLFSGLNITEGSLEPTTKHPWKQFDELTLDEGREDFHLTFPIITRQRVYTSMFIETIDIVESVDKGMNKLTITLFFRKYTPQRPYDYVKVEKPKQEGQYTNYYRKSQITWKQMIGLSFLKVVEFVLSATLVYFKFFIEKDRADYSMSQILSLVFCNRLSRAEGSIGVDFKNVNFKETLLGLF